MDAPAQDDAADSGEDAPATDAAGDTAADGADAATDGAAGLTCPATINGMLETTDPTQVGRHSRVAPSSICGVLKTYPSNMADPSFPHVYDVYRFANRRAAAACFTFTLTYPIIDAGMGNDRYAVAYTSFNPADISSGYLGDVGSVTTSPQTMGITVAAGTSIDVVVYAIQATNSGNPYVGPYTLSCATQ